MHKEEEEPDMEVQTVKEAITGISEIVGESDDRYEEILHSCISLKSLFERKNMDEYHVDCLVLYRIAMRVLHIMKELRTVHICPGLYDLKDFYVNMREDYPVFLLHPERFQVFSCPQDYEWYPEDERVFGDLQLFDEKSQRKADVRLIYKILVASTRGNVKIPPKETRTDYSSLFFKTLSPELKSIFLKEADPSHDEIESLLLDAIALEKESSRKVKEKLDEKAVKLSSDQMYPELSEYIRPDTFVADGRQCQVYSMFVLMRTETVHSGRISRMLYQEQDRLELATSLAHQQSRQAFVYGDGFIQARDFKVYPAGFRIQLRQQIRDYSSAQAMIIACEIVKKHRIHFNHGKDTLRICLITDGRLKNDRLFQIALDRLTSLADQGCELRFIYDPAYPCDACDRLEKLCDQYKKV